MILFEALGGCGLALVLWWIAATLDGDRYSRYVDHHLPGHLPSANIVKWFSDGDPPYHDPRRRWGSRIARWLGDCFGNHP